MPTPTIRKRYVPWKDREHLFTPLNITKLEFISACAFRPCSCCPMSHRRLKALRHGPVIWIVRDGKAVDFSAEDKIENELIEKGPQLPEDRSGEPDQFYLDEV